MKSIYLQLLFIAGMGLYFNSCHKEPDPSVETETGRIRLNFLHYVHGQPLIPDSMRYVNSSGNSYEVNEIMYFISDVRLCGSGGTKQIIDDWKDIHYIDIDIPSTLSWNVFDEIPAGEYDSITFIFGITAAKNESFMFVNFPESQMMWPDILGGGYHYMMINGKWLDPGQLKQVFNFHLGIGQLYKSDTIKWDSIYAYVQNYFPVHLQGSSFTLKKDSTVEIDIIMNVDSWFNTPHYFDFNYWGGEIMQNQPAMQIVKENGFDVFSIGEIR